MCVCVSDGVGGGGGGLRPGPRDQPVIKVITVCAYTGLRFFVPHPSSSAAATELRAATAWSQQAQRNHHRGGDGGV